MTDCCVDERYPISQSPNIPISSHPMRISSISFVRHVHIAHVSDSACNLYPTIVSSCGVLGVLGVLGEV